MTPKQHFPSKLLPRIDHITLTVKDFEKSKEFYKSLFVDYLCGFVLLDTDDVFGVRFGSNFLFEISPENPEFAGSKFNRYQVGLHHFALELENKEAVDNIYKKLLDLKVEILDKPAFYPKYENGYYAVYWKDLNSFKMEFVAYER